MEATLFRFAIGQSEGRHSASWRLWSQGGDVYLLHRDHGNIDKFSFHNSGHCRWALIEPLKSGRDRATVKWKRKPIPPVGLKQGSLLLSIIVPTDHLLTGQLKKPKQLYWIEPAPPKHAAIVEIFLTNEDEETIRKEYASGSRKLEFFGKTRIGTNLCVSTYHQLCELKKLNMPKNPRVPGQVFGEVIIPDDDTEYDGRALRITMAQPMKETDTALTIWELKSYEVAKLNT